MAWIEMGCISDLDNVEYLWKILRCQKRKQTLQLYLDIGQTWLDLHSLFKQAMYGQYINLFA